MKRTSQTTLTNWIKRTKLEEDPNTNPTESNFEKEGEEEDNSSTSKQSIIEFMDVYEGSNSIIEGSNHPTEVSEESLDTENKIEKNEIEQVKDLLFHTKKGDSFKEGLYILATKLEEELFWQKNLDESEYQILKHILESSPTEFEKFLNEIPEQNALEKPNILNFKVKNHLFDILTNVTILKHTSFRTLTEISNLANINRYVTLEEDAEDLQRELSSISRIKEMEDFTSSKESLSSESASNKNVSEGDIEKKGDSSSKRSKSKTNFSNRELRSLLTDNAHKKWKGVIEFEGQGELYDALDEVLTKLKDCHEHSYPFLTRVRKVDAPDYYDVIKKPMDLGLMTKKLHKGEYLSKAEFQADLNLIFSNCREYNTDPSSKIYLIHADALEKKAKEWMRNVKPMDFTKQKKELLNSTNESEPKIKKKSKTEETEDSDELTEKEKEKEKEREKESTIEKSIERRGRPRKYKRQPDSSVNDEFDVNLIKTRSDRLTYLKYRQQQQTLPFSQRYAFIRSVQQMDGFLQAQKEELYPPPPSTPVPTITMTSPTNSNPAPEVKEKQEFYPEISYFMGCVPDLQQFTNEKQSVEDNQIIMAKLRKSIGLLLNELDIESCEESALDVLVDILKYFFESFGKELNSHLVELTETKNSLEQLIRLSVSQFGISPTEIKLPQKNSNQEELLKAEVTQT